MRLHRFFIDEQVGNKTELNIHSAELVNQIRRVFRLKKGDSIVVFDGSGFDYECRIGESSGGKDESVKNLVTLDVVTTMKSRYMPARDIYLCAAVVKKDTFEWIVEKATELGVTHIIPVMAERSEKKSLNEKRLAKIAVEASEQSGRGSVPTIAPIVGLREAVESFNEVGESKVDEVSKVNGLSDSRHFTQVKYSILAFHTDVEPFDHTDFSKDLPKDGPIAIFIGPEGGWSMDEIDLFHRNEIQIVSLGKQVLRAETAVIAALSEVVFG
jgi:16S rRNA (uracil1498-N3)-methyltransferase